jgi:hypothetical protein
MIQIINEIIKNELFREYMSYAKSVKKLNLSNRQDAKNAKDA